MVGIHNADGLVKLIPHHGNWCGKVTIIRYDNGIIEKVLEAVQKQSRGDVNVCSLFFKSPDLYALRRLSRWVNPFRYVGQWVLGK